MRYDEAGRRLLAITATITAALGTASLAVTLSLRLSAADLGSGSAWRTWALAETGALLALMVLTARVAPRRPAVAATALGGAALTGVWLLRFDPPGVSPVMLVGLGFWAAVAAAAGGAGIYLRSLDDRHARALAAVRADHPASLAVAAPGSEPLTRRELEVATLVARGRTNGEIAAELFLSAGTVKNHVAKIQRKLGARNRVGIAAWVLTPRGQRVAR